MKKCIFWKFIKIEFDSIKYLGKLKWEMTVFSKLTSTSLFENFMNKKIVLKNCNVLLHFLTKLGLIQVWILKENEVRNCSFFPTKTSISSFE